MKSLKYLCTSYPTESKAITALIDFYPSSYEGGKLFGCMHHTSYNMENACRSVVTPSEYSIFGTNGYVELLGLEIEIQVILLNKILGCKSISWTDNV